MKKLYIVTGCTATGKTEYAIDLAKKISAEIVSCDSMLVYRGMDIGTAKPTKREQEDVKHHVVDVVSPDRNFNVAEYVSCARKAIDDIFGRGKNVVIVGGSGFYLKSFFYPVIDDVPIRDDIDKYVDEMYSVDGHDGIVKELLVVNNGDCGTVDIKNPRRVMRALKRCLSSGKTINDLMSNFKSIRPEFDEFDKFTILLDAEKDVITDRIAARTSKMISNGLIDEVAGLTKKYEHLCSSAKNSIGYRETIEWLKNPTTTDDLLRSIIQNTLKLVKKQRTWFRSQIPIDAKLMVK